MKIKKIFSLLLAFCLAVRLIPIAAFAADYNVTINGIAITDSNANDVLGDGTVSYDADTNTLQPALHRSQPEPITFIQLQCCLM